MKIPQGSDSKHYIEPERAAGKDRTRPMLTEPWLEIDSEGKGTLYATDSYVAVRVPVELDKDDTPGVVPAAALKAARSARWHDPEVFLNGSASALGKDGTVTVERPERDNPNVAQLFVAETTEGEGTVTIGIDPEKLQAVALALGARRGVKLTIRVEPGYGSLKPFYVEPLHTTHDGVGLVMPIKLPAR